MDAKEKQRWLSMISDYNAYKGKGSRLYEISVETNKKHEFVCKGVLRLYWDIQRPIVLNKKATSSFVQKRERTSKIVGRPTCRRRKDDSDDLTPGCTPSVTPCVTPSVTPTSGSPKESSALSSSVATEYTAVAKKPDDLEVGEVMQLKRSSAPECTTLNSPDNSSLSPVRVRSSTFLGAPDFQPTLARSSSLSSPAGCISFTGWKRPDIDPHGLSLLTRRSKQRLKSSSTSNSPTRLAAEEVSADNLEMDHTALQQSASHDTHPAGKGGSPNLSRYITSSFRRSRSPRPVSTSAAATGTVKTSSSASRLETLAVNLDSHPQEKSTLAEPSKADGLKHATKRRGPSFRRSPNRGGSPNRNPSLSEADCRPGNSVNFAKGSGNDTSEKSGSLFNFLQRPRISFRRIRGSSPSSTGSANQFAISAEVAVSDDPESLAEFYQPPKGSLTNVRATSDMTVLEVIAATLNKLSAVDEPTRFAIFSIDDRGTVKLVQDDVQMLFYRVKLGPKEDVVKLFIMERDTNDAQDFSAEVMQYYHLGMPFLESLVMAYEAEEEREIERIQLKYADARQRLVRRLQAAKEAEEQAEA